MLLAIRRADCVVEQSLERPIVQAVGTVEKSVRITLLVVQVFLDNRRTFLSFIDEYDEYTD